MDPKVEDSIAKITNLETRLNATLQILSVASENGNTVSSVLALQVKSLTQQLTTMTNTIHDLGIELRQASLRNSELDDLSTSNAAKDAVILAKQKTIESHEETIKSLHKSAKDTDQKHRKALAEVNTELGRFRANQNTSSSRALKELQAEKNLQQSNFEKRLQVQIQTHTAETRQYVAALEKVKAEKQEMETEHFTYIGQLRGQSSESVAGIKQKLVEEYRTHLVAKNAQYKIDLDEKDKSFSEERRGLQTRLEDLSGQVVALTRERDTAIKDNAASRRERQEIALAHIDCAKKLEDVVKQKDNAVAQSRTYLAAEIKRGESLAKQFDDIREERDTIREERDFAQAEVATTMTHLRTANKRGQELARQRDDIRNERDALRNERDAIRDSRDAVRGERDALRGEKNATKAELAITKTRLQEQEQNRDTYDRVTRERYSEPLDTAKKEIESFKRDLEILERARTDRMTEFVALEAQRDTLEEQIRDHVDELEHIRADHARLMEEQDQEFTRSFASQKQVFDQKISEIESEHELKLAAMAAEQSVIVRQLTEQLQLQQSQRAVKSNPIVVHINARTNADHSSATSLTEVNQALNHASSHESQRDQVAEPHPSIEVVETSEDTPNEIELRANNALNDTELRIHPPATPASSKRHALDNVGSGSKRLRSGTVSATPRSTRSPSTARSDTSRQANQSARRAAAVSDAPEKAEQIWSLVHIDWEYTDEERQQLFTQFSNLFNRGRAVARVREAIDKHVVGNFREQPAYPRPCLFGTLNNEGGGRGGAMTRTTCPWCKKTHDRVCVWAEYAEGVASGYGDRDDETGAVTDTKWRPDPSPSTVLVNGRQVRWILKKRREGADKSARSNSRASSVASRVL